MTEVMLNASMRSNLLSLQQTQNLQDRTQLRLSTGLKVNSAIDNPSSYYTAISLNNRASDLSALLDTMSQGIQTIRAANEAIETGTALLQQAKSVAEKASESSVDIVAKVNNEAELLAAVENGGPGYIVIENDITLTNQIRLKDGQKLVGDNYFAGNDSPNRKLSFDFTGKSEDAIIAANNSIVSNLDIFYETDSDEINHGVLTARGAQNVNISNINLTFNTSDIATSGSRFGIMADDGANVILQGQINIQGLSNQTVGIGVYGETTIDNYADLNISTKFHGIKIGNGSTNEPKSTFNIHEGTNINISSTSHTGMIIFAQSSLNIHGATINIASQGTGINNTETSSLMISNSQINIKSSSYAITTQSSNTIIKNSELNLESINSHTFYMNSSTGDSASVNIDGTSRINAKTKNQHAFRMVTYSTGTSTSLNIDKGAVININANKASDALWTFEDDYHFSEKKEPNDTTSTLNTYIDDFEGSATKSAAEAFPDGEPAIPDIEQKLSETFSGNASFDAKKADNNSYMETISQYDMLVNDASYKGVNLLQNNDLKINFNEDRSFGVVVEGVDASSKGLGIRNLEWSSQMDILNSVKELESAINQLRSFSTEFGNYYAIVTTREDFTKNLINVLTEGADKLTLADMNEESANMLALQTRQQLAINSLSLASSAAQSVLRLF